MYSADEQYIQKTFDLALEGLGTVTPNPLVGAVIVKAGQVIAEGFHKRSGDHHAEVNAILNSNISVEGATLYSNLEPCCHTNKKTPPCTDLIIAKKIKEVIVSNLDPNPEVSGNGLERLKDNGILVRSGILEAEGEKLNEIFFKYIKENKPFVHLKYAQTLDGKIADFEGSSRWISNEVARTQVHALRLKYDAVLIGAGTNNLDMPTLNIRMGIDSKGKIPYRIVVGNPCSLNFKSPLFSDDHTDKTILVTDLKNWNETNIDIKNHLSKFEVQVIAIDEKYGSRFIEAMLIKLAELKITSVLVEGGSMILSQFLESQLYDKLSCFISPKILGRGKDVFSFEINRKISEAIELEDIKMELLENQILVEGYRKHNIKSTRNL